MHIALFIHALTVGGAQNRTLAIANGLAERGHRVDLIVAAQGAPNEDKLNPRIRFMPLSSRASASVGTGLRRVADLTTSIPALVRYLNAETPDVFIGMANHVAPIAVLAHVMMRKPRSTALVLRASNHITHSAQAKGTYLRRLHLLPIWRQADHIIAVSRSVAQSLTSGLNIAPERVTVLPSPILPDNLGASTNVDPGHPWLSPEDSGPPVIVGIGRFVHQKGFDLLIEAFSRVSRQQPCRLLLFGDGPQREALTNRIQQLGLTELVSMPGVTSRPYAVLSRADLFVLPSRWEGMPAVLIEALASGCPVVAADCPGGVAEVIEDGRIGGLVPIDNVAALADAMLEGLSRQPDREALRQAALPYQTGPAITAFEDWLRAYLHRSDTPAMALETGRLGG